MAHVVRILTEYILPERDPSVALIWSSEPDKSQHDAGVGFDLSNAAVGEADAQFGSILRWLDETGRAGETNVMVVSDHGYSTIGQAVNGQALVREAGFPPGGKPGGVVVANNGGAVLFYSSLWDRGTSVRLARWLMAQPWCGNVTVGERRIGQHLAHRVPVQPELPRRLPDAHPLHHHRPADTKIHFHSIHPLHHP